MKLLFLTQVLDRRDGVLGFVVRWIEEFAKHTDGVRVVALEVGDTTGLPDNVDWVEIGRQGRIGRYLKYRRTLAEALGSGPRGGFDAVLAHMVPRYALVAAKPAKRAGARLYLWYTHKGVDARLRKAVPLTLKTFSASEESLRLESDRRVITGHGIDTEHFDLAAPAFAPPLQLLSVGRLTPAKDPLTVLRAVGRLVEDGFDVRLDWVGGGLTSGDVEFRGVVAAEVARLGLGDRAVFHGEVPYSEVDARFRSADMLINASFTGSVDKVVLEAMAARRPAISCNDSFPPIFAGLDDPGAFAARAASGRSAALLFPGGDDEALAARVETLLAMGPNALRELGEDLRTIVVRDHGVAALCERLIREMQP
jgi:glycosyltransferase involved in cell wall biosynthesis